MYSFAQRVQSVYCKACSGGVDGLKSLTVLGEKDCGDAGLNLVCESVTCCDAPDDAALEACRALGKALVE